MITNKQTSVLIVNEERIFDLPDLDLRFSGWVRSIMPKDGRVAIELQTNGSELSTSKNKKRVKKLFGGYNK